MSHDCNDAVEGDEPQSAPETRSGKEGRRREPLAATGRHRGRATRPMDPSRPCLNCGDPAPGEYCPTCGQRKVDVQVSLRTLFMDVLEDQFILDRRLPRTLGALFFHPGFLTTEHVNGRIVRYIHPFRLYLVSSLLFFLLLSFFSLQLVRRAMDQERGTPVAVPIGAGGLDEALADLRLELADTTATEEEISALRSQEADLVARRRQVQMDSLTAEVAELTDALRAIERTAADTTLPGAARRAAQIPRPEVERQLAVASSRRDALAADTLDPNGAPGAVAEGERGRTTGSDDRPLREVFGWDESPPEIHFGLLPALDSALQTQVQRIGYMTGREAAETLLSTFLSYVPTMMFILLPVFAGVLKLLYIRRRRFYAEHFVFLLHAHSFVFLLATLMVLLRAHTPVLLWVALLGWIVVYIYLAMKRVYGQGWFKTAVKWWALGWAYFFVLSISIPLAFVATLLFF